MCSIIRDGVNLLIMGCPGSGKTTAGKIVAETLGMTFIDFDNDVLEPVWNMKVCTKLMEVGDEQFLKEENAVFQSYSTNNCVISLSGSNPMADNFRDHAQMLGISFYLDVRQEDILKYLNKKTEDAANCIVGKHTGMSWEEIIEYRQQFYINNYDIRILCEQEENPSSVAAKIVQKWLSMKNNSIHYLSTRGGTTQESKSFFDIVIEGLAHDGGLYVPKEIPQFTSGQWQRLISLSYQQRASLILEAWISHSDIHPSQLRKIIEKAYNSFQHKKVAPVTKIKEDVFLLELYYGPTASFKDLALQLMPPIFELATTQQYHTLCDDDIQYLLLVATSGDTGSAVLEGFKNHHNISVIVFYPEYGTSLIQKKQMTSMHGDNIKVVGIHGDFDFCQTTIKAIFNDVIFSQYLLQKYKCKLTAANSINWGRLLPQIVYHASGYLDLVAQGEIEMGDKVDICIPTGNFGNILAAFYAKKMGIPFDHLICASNCNNVLSDFIITGTYNLNDRNLIQSISPSIDILKSSNLERLLYHYTEDSTLVQDLFQQLDKEKYFTIPEQLHRNIKDTFQCGWASEQECKDAIRLCFKDSKYIADPHTAVALHVAKQFNNNNKVLVTATAHFSKFPKEVLAALGEEMNDETPECLLKQLEELEAMKGKPDMNNKVKEAIMKPVLHKDVCNQNIDEIKKMIEQFLRNTDNKKNI